MRLNSRSICALVALSLVALTSSAQTPAALGPNSDPVYQQLRNIGMGSEAVTVKDFELKRDAATFHLNGYVCFVAPVNGKVTGAVFVGDGKMVIDPPIPMEKSSLKLLTKSDEFVEQYEHLVLRFTDSTYEEIKKAGTAGGSCDAGLLHDSQNAMRHSHFMKYNLDARILQDVLSAEPGGLFVAFVHGKKYNGKEIYFVDPHGAPESSPPSRSRRDRVSHLRRQQTGHLGSVPFFAGIQRWKRDRNAAELLVPNHASDARHHD